MTWRPADGTPEVKSFANASCMVGMMAAMALGMTIGLGMDTLLAIWLPGQFFQATMLSMQGEIKAEDFSFNPSSLRIAANEQIRITWA